MIFLSKLIYFIYNIINFIFFYISILLWKMKLKTSLGTWQNMITKNKYTVVGKEVWKHMAEPGIELRTPATLVMSSTIVQNLWYSLASQSKFRQIFLVLFLSKFYLFFQRGNYQNVVFEKHARSIVFESGGGKILTSKKKKVFQNLENYNPWVCLWGCG